MKVTETELAGVVILEPRVFGDARGYFFEAWNRERMREIGLDAEYLQDNESMSARGVLRGLHYQLPPYSQAKLVRVVRGRVLDVVVDIRRGSPTFGRHVALELSGDRKRMLFIPRGFAHGFLALEEETIFVYKCDRPYMASHERGINPRDPELGINWGGLAPEACRLSPKDSVNPLLSQAEVYEYRDGNESY